MKRASKHENDFDGKCEDEVAFQVTVRHTERGMV